MQGSGKGTQAKLLAKEFGLKHICIGMLLREEEKSGSELGKQIGKSIEKGNFAPDDAVLSILKKNLTEKFILDGHPRNLEQVKYLEELVKIDKVIHLEISEETGIKRLSGRKQCKKCGFIFGLDLGSGKECEKCGGELYTREDDYPEAIKRRIELYKKRTYPIVEYYKKQGILITINGERSREEIFEDIKKAI